MLSGETRRGDIQAVSGSTVNFAASAGLASRPIRLWAPSGRQAALTALPSAVTISGGSGTKYIYAVLAAPSGNPYSTESGGLLDRILNLLPWNRADWYAALRSVHPGDGTLIDPARSSAVTLEMTTSATPTDSHRVPLGEVAWDGSSITSLVSYEGQVSVTVSAFVHGQCRLSKSGANLVLLPYNGTNLVINGTARAVPGAGVTLAPTGLTPGTLYYIYAMWNGSTIVLEASTTGHSTHADGVEIKTGDSTRTLVGMARPITGPAWQDSVTGPAQRFVLSWFNRRRLSAHGSFSADRSTTSATFVELNTEIRAEVLTWADESIIVDTDGSRETNNAATSVVGVAFDGTTPASAVAYGNKDTFPVSVHYSTQAASEGYHYITLVGSVSGGNTLTFHSADTAPTTAKCRIIATIRG